MKMDNLFIHSASTLYLSSASSYTSYIHFAKLTAFYLDSAILNNSVLFKSSCSVLLYKKAIDFCTQILTPMFLLSSLVPGRIFEQQFIFIFHIDDYVINGKW